MSYQHRSVTDRFALAILVLGFASCRTDSNSQIEVKASGTPPVGTVFLSVLDLHQKPGLFVPELRHAIEATSTDWPVSFYASFSTDKGPASCTAALVGPQVLLTAAHCVPKDGLVSFKFGKDTYSTTCRIPEAYATSMPDLSADFALCKLKMAFPLPGGFRFEKIATPSLDQMLGIAVVLTGFGCTSDVASLGLSDGKYRVGTNSVAQTSNSSPPQAPLTAEYYRPTETNNLITGIAGANLCPGDSGGPAFQIVAGPETGNQYANRVLVGVNSRVVYADSSHLVYGQSLISATGGPSFATWAKEWAVENGVAICGLVGAVSHCRGSGA